MGKTSIEWTDRSINPIRALRIGDDGAPTGPVGHYCEKISPGCAKCYASRMQSRFGMPRFVGARQWPMTAQGDNGTVRVDSEVKAFFDETKLEEVLRRRKPTNWFWCDMTDLFGSWVPDGWIVKCWMAMVMTPWHTHQVLTKRPDRMLDFVTRWGDLAGELDEPQLVRGPDETRKAHPSGRGQLYAAQLDTMGAPPPGRTWPTFDWMEGPRWWPTEPAENIWIGVSVEDQTRADQRIPLLLQTPASVRFLSCEPLLAPVDLTTVRHTLGKESFEVASVLEGDDGFGLNAVRNRVDWVIVGGESGPGARPMHPDWARSLREQCVEAGVPYFFKQWGEWVNFEDGDGAHGRVSGDDVHSWPNGRCSYRVGKRAAGRLLDGREWSERPIPKIIFATP